MIKCGKRNHLCFDGGNVKVTIIDNQLSEATLLLALPAMNDMFGIITSYCEKKNEV